MEKARILYLDTSSPEMEQILIDSCPPEFELLFLDPCIGKRGTFEEADYIINSVYPVRRAEIDAAPNVKLIHRTGVGYDNVDVAYAAEKGIPVCITPNCLNDSVAELIIMHILAVYRRLSILDSTTRAGEWRKWEYKHLSFELKGKSIGVIGAGRIGQAFIQKLKGFEPGPIYYSNRRRLSPEQEEVLGASYLTVDELVAQSDVVVLTVPLNPDTDNIMNAQRIAGMKKGSILINVSRGACVDYDALIEALRSGHLLGAGLDVFPTEPLDPASELTKLENVSMTPHIGSSTVDAFRNVCRMCMENISLHAAGKEPNHIVNLK